MKKINLFFVILFMVLTTIPLLLQSQNCDWNELHSKIMKQKKEFLQKELALENKQMEIFWDVYVQYDKEISDSHNEAWQKQKEITKTESDKKERVQEELLSDDVALQLINQRMLLDRKLQQINEKYSKEFLKVLSAQKVLKLHRLEKQFMRDVMAKYPKNKNKNAKENKNCRNNKPTKQVEKENKIINK